MKKKNDNSHHISAKSFFFLFFFKSYQSIRWWNKDEISTYIISTNSFISLDLLDLRNKISY